MNASWIAARGTADGGGGWSALAGIPGDGSSAVIDDIIAGGCVLSTDIIAGGGSLSTAVVAGMPDGGWDAVITGVAAGGGWSAVVAGMGGGDDGGDVVMAGGSWGAVVSGIGGGGDDAGRVHGLVVVLAVVVGCPSGSSPRRAGLVMLVLC